MAMAITNLAANQIIGRLNKNDSTAQKYLRQAATGMKINSAADNASTYSISEKMRVEIRALDQAHQNVQNGSSLLKTGSGGINNIVDNLHTLKELAINAANDSNTNADRALIQTEFSQRLANINDIVAKTNFNGRILLDGTYSQKSFTVTETGQTVETVETAATTLISAGDYTITEDGVYSLADGYTGTVTINAQNVKLTQQTPATQLNNVSIVTRAEGNSNLWIENLNIANIEDKNIIKFQGANNYLSVKGTNTLDNSALIYSATVNIGGGLKIVGDGSLTAKGSYSGAGIGGEVNGIYGDLVIGDNVTITATSVMNGSAIGSGERGIIRNILIGDNANITATSNSGAAVGSGQNGTVGNISIGDNATITARTFVSGSGYGTFGAGIGNGSGRDSAGGIIEIGGNAVVVATAYQGAGIGSGGGGGYTNSVGEIKIGGNANVIATSFSGAGIGSGDPGSNAGDITISDSAIIKAKSNVGENIGKGHYGSTVGTISNGLTTFDITLDLGIVAQIEPQANLETSTITIDTTQTKEISGNPLHIQSGTTAEDFINIFIEDMRTKALGAGKLFDGDNLINASDIAHCNTLNDSVKKSEWLATLRAADNKTLDDISVTTKENANIAIRVIDGAIEYALNQASNLGAMEIRLGYTSDNLTTETENTQAAESTIRDADIPKTISRYAKYILLTQTAQIMLVQANQNSNAVLGLLE